MSIKGIARADKRTKDLAKRLCPNEIAFIDHADIDEVAAISLLEAKIKAVVNADKFISGRYPNQGPKILLEGGIALFEHSNKELINLISEGETVEIKNGVITKENALLVECEEITLPIVEKKLIEARENIHLELDKFVQNTLEYAKKEKGIILGELAIPDVAVKIKGRQVLIVVRGQNYKEDLQALGSYIKDMKPVLVGVDGGADALREFGYTPDLIIGDMDSITDATLKCGAEVLVHAYSDGRAPGLERTKKLGVEAKTFPAPGTSEDIAMLLAYEKGAELIVALGTHSNMIDFLDKGRKGMASTFLIRLKVGSILIDAKGVNKLYQGRIKLKYILFMTLAALTTILIVLLVSPLTRPLLRSLYLLIRTNLRF